MTRNACDLHTGQRVHATPHDVWEHHSTWDQWFTLTTEPIPFGGAVQLVGRTDTGERFATTYLLLQPVEVAA